MGPVMSNLHSQTGRWALLKLLFYARGNMGSEWLSNLLRVAQLAEWSALWPVLPGSLTRELLEGNSFKGPGVCKVTKTWLLWLQGWGWGRLELYL